METGGSSANLTPLEKFCVEVIHFANQTFEAEIVGGPLRKHLFGCCR